MSTPFDVMTKTLDGALSEEQRKIWHDMCAELVVARMRIQDLEARLKTLKKQGTLDGLAQTVLSKPDFNREVARMLAADERYGTMSSVLYFDIEQLDKIKERHGGEFVDDSIRCVCDTLLASVRRTDILGRLAPDEFGILMPRCSNEAAWKKGEFIASSIFDALSKSWGPNLRPSVSYGAYTFGDKENLAHGLKKAASSLTRLVKQ